jgi:hypothetical protein
VLVTVLVTGTDVEWVTTLRCTWAAAPRPQGGPADPSSPSAAPPS